VFLIKGNSASHSGLTVGWNEQRRGYRIYLYLEGYILKKYVYEINKEYLYQYFY
jgi:hypothetical protein